MRVFKSDPVFFGPVGHRLDHRTVQVVNLGERSGRLEGMLLHAATAFDRRVNTSLKMFTKALPPFLIMVMATIGGFVLAAILLPLMELQSAFS